MVARIKTGHDINTALNYNEHKVKRGAAQLIYAKDFLKDIPQLSYKDKLFVFKNLTALNQRTKTNSVHISLNFDPSEKFSNEKFTEIAARYMDKIGFGDQPFLVYKHSDAGHPHLHIVTTNIQLDGSRIALHNIGKLKSEPARKQIEKDFGLVPAESKGQDQPYQLKPVLKDKDLRPYIFISKEKAISFDQEQALTPILLSMLTRLESGALMYLNEVEREMNSITPQEATILFEKLLTPCKSKQDLTRQPTQMKGIFRIIKVFPQLEIKLMEFLSSKPATSLGAWAVSESAGLQTQEARTKFNTLLEIWKAKGTKTLKALAGQTTKL